MLPKMKISANARTDRSPYWHSGQWNGRIFIGVPNMYSAFGNGYSIETDEEGTFSLSFSYVTESLIHLVQKSNGNMEQRSWDDKKKDWVVVLKALHCECDFYGRMQVEVFGELFLYSVCIRYWHYLFVMDQKPN
ncbi:g-type lectin s-receptor-like serine/threonine-protein kinase [Quercus suber]|uniref:G-type lectin s-receptor-like serine/threonine-protein kinase n=1 Tax=Quercus suber TaxID=58331 RepID=A0AAW0KEG5_QUESU